MANWYYLQKGRPHGPVTTEDIKKEIAAGRMGANDLLYREHDTSWREAAYFIDLQGHFKEQKYDDGWVLLLRKRDGSGYVQKGPFTKVQITSLLKNGEISFTDYVWRKGLKEWYKILAIPEFHMTSTAKSSQKKELPLPIIESILPEDLSAITMKLPMPQEEKDIRPPEATDESDVDTQPKIENTPIKKNLRRSKKGVNQEIVKEAQWVRRISFTRYFLELTSTNKIIFGTGVIAAFVAGLIILTYVSSYIDRRRRVLKSPEISYVPSNLSTKKKIEQLEERKPQPSESLAKQIESKPLPTPMPTPMPPTQPPPQPETAKVVEVANVSPTYLRYEKLFDGKESARLKIFSDASKHYPIHVIFSADASQILGVRSVRRAFTLTQIEDRDIDISKAGMPPGYYQVSLSCKTFEAQTKFNFATELSDFKKKLFQHRKQLIIYHNEERYSFIKTAARLEKEVYKFAQNVKKTTSLNSWRNFYRPWRNNFDRINNKNISSVNQSNWSNYVYAEKWFQLKQLRSEIMAQIKSVNNSKTKGLPINNDAVKSSALDLTRLKEQMIMTTLWRKD
ncbi:MAG: hypothetical protein A2Z20_10560 [Bdellovibrionales bacterium RBG_16_40_8]|nr:MAG: hypothetical protein A2Z20_10560 [Bdellovibrionales bacterium RBG_16_40_8]